MNVYCQTIILNILVYNQIPTDLTALASAVLCLVQISNGWHTNMPIWDYKIGKQYTCLIEC